MTAHPKTLDALRDELQWAEKHAARCEAGEVEARNQWQGAENTGASLRVVNRAWSTYCTALEVTSHAHAVVTKLRAELQQAEAAEKISTPAAHEVPEWVAAAESGAGDRVVVLTQLQCDRLQDVIGERCDKLHASKVALQNGSATGTATRVHTLTDSLKQWEAVEKAIKDSTPAAVFARQLCRELRETTREGQLVQRLRYMMRAAENPGDMGRNDWAEQAREIRELLTSMGVMP